MIKILVRAAVVLAVVAAIGVSGVGGASAGTGAQPTIDVSGVAAYFGASDGTGVNFTPGGPVDVLLYDADADNPPLIASTRVTATVPYHYCARFVCANYPGGEISWHLVIGQQTCSHNLWIHAVDVSTLRNSNWIFAVHYCYVHGG
jgi:hypothetical protein